MKGYCNLRGVDDFLLRRPDRLVVERGLVGHGLFETRLRILLLKRSFVRMIVGLSSLFGFIITTVLVVSGVSQNADLGAALLVNHYDLGSVGTSLMVLVTSYGREVVWGLLVIIMFLVGGKRTKLLAVELVALFIIGILVGDLAKMLVQRPRPDLASGIVLRVPAETDPSYPSGHVLIVSIGAAFAIARFHRKILGCLAGFGGGACLLLAGLRWGPLSAGCCWRGSARNRDRAHRRNCRRESSRNFFGEALRADNDGA